MLQSGWRAADPAAPRQLREALDKENPTTSLHGERFVASKPVTEPSAALKPQQSHAAPSQRRPLGNITNAKGDKAGAGSSGNGDVKKGGSMAASGSVSRRAFGDLTNSLTKPSDSKTRSQAAATSAASLKASAKARVVQQGGDDAIERRAGKSWDQMEAERRLETERAISMRVRTLTSIPMWQPAENFKSLAATPSGEGEDMERDDMDLSPEPVVKPPGLSGSKLKLGPVAAPTFSDLSSGGSVSPASLDLLTSPSPDCLSLSDLLINSEEEDLLL